MKYTNNAIFTKVRAAVLATYSSATCTQTYSPTPASYPTVFCREIGRFTPTQAATFGNAQDISERTWEVQVYSNLKSGQKEQAYGIMDCVKSAFRAMYFLEISETPIDSTNGSHFTLVARFRRVIGSGETIPT